MTSLGASIILSGTMPNIRISLEGSTKGSLFFIDEIKKYPKMTQSGTEFNTYSNK